MKKSCIFFIVIGFCQLFASIELYCQEQDVEQIILNNDTSSFNRWLSNHDPEGFYSSRCYTPLIYSIVLNKPEIVKLLLARGAKLENSCETKSPLLFALEYNRSSIVRFLIRSGANINARDSLNNTALFYAAYLDNIPIMRLLIRKGVPIEAKNKLHITARNYAALCDKQKAAKFLAYYFEKHLPNYCDGPYVHFKRNSIRIYYLLHDSLKSQSDIINYWYRTKINRISFKGFASDTNSYIVLRNPKVEAAEFPLNSKIFVLGDVHGDYYGMINLLQKGKVIDEHLNWIWGTGHLIFLGDIVDRGEHVTECLWLIFKLEQQARKQSGYVHYLLGNHEIMIMNKDYRYLADKYFYLNDRLKIDFSEHYDQNSFFGKWLGSKNSMVKIGPYLFLHAGLSYEAFQRKYHMDEINSVIRKYIKDARSNSVSDTIKWALSDDGPLWYRGYNTHYKSSSPINDAQLDSILNFYNVKTIFVGHSHTSEIKSVFNGRVILMDVPYYLEEAEPEAIKIDSTHILLFKADKNTEQELKH